MNFLIYISLIILIYLLGAFVTRAILAHVMKNSWTCDDSEQTLISIFWFVVVPFMIPFFILKRGFEISSELGHNFALHKGQIKSFFKEKRKKKELKKEELRKKESSIINLTKLID